MQISLIVAHPDPSSLNHALAQSIRSTLEAGGADVRFHDLYAERFDPLLSAEEIRTHRSSDLTVERHAEELTQADGLVIVHPVWFDAPPAILKGWVERVVRDGTAFDRTSDGGFVGRLRADAAMVVTTANAPADDSESDALAHFWQAFVLPTSGVETIERLHLTSVVASDLATRQGWLDQASERAERLFLAG